MQVGDAAVGVDHRHVGPVVQRGGDRGVDLGLLIGGQGVDRREHARPAVVRLGTCGLEHVAVLLEDRSEERLDRMPEDDGVGDLHHRRLHVEREQHSLGLGVVDLLVQEPLERRDRHERAVDHFAGLHEHGGGEHRHVAVGVDVFDAQVVGGVHRDRLFVRLEVVVAHGRHVRLGVARPVTHRMRVLAGVLLDGLGRTPVGVSLTQYRVDGRTLDLVVARLDVAFGVGAGIVGVVGERVPLGLQLGDRGFQLWQRRRDVRELDDVRFGRRGEFTQLGEVVRLPLIGFEEVGELRDDPPRQRDVPLLERHPGGPGEGRDDRQQ